MPTYKDIHPHLHTGKFQIQTWISLQNLQIQQKLNSKTSEPHYESTRTANNMPDTFLLATFHEPSKHFNW